MGEIWRSLHVIHSLEHIQFTIKCVTMDEYSKEQGKSYEVNMRITIIQREHIASFSYQ